MTTCNCFVDEDGVATICHACAISIQEFKDKRKKFENTSRSDLVRMCGDLNYYSRTHPDAEAEKAIRVAMHYIESILDQYYDTPSFKGLPRAVVDITEDGVFGGPVDDA